MESVGEGLQGHGEVEPCPEPTHETFSTLSLNFPIRPLQRSDSKSWISYQEELDPLTSVGEGLQGL